MHKPSYLTISLWTSLSASVNFVTGRRNIFYEMRLKSPEQAEDEDDEVGCTDREAETEYAARDLAKEIKEKHCNDLGIVYCLRKMDCEHVRRKYALSLFLAQRFLCVFFLLSVFLPCTTVCSRQGTHPSLFPSFCVPFLSGLRFMSPSSPSTCHCRLFFN